jgi:p-hydroxybenzoate 3-monooxygenase
LETAWTYYSFFTPLSTSKNRPDEQEGAMKTQVAIIGGGPSGLLLAQLLHRRGIETVVLERKTKDYVLGRIRAGVLEQGLVRMLEEAGCADRLHAEGHVHAGTLISYGDQMFRVDFTEHTGTPVIVYGQTEVTRDLYAAREAAGGIIEYEVEDVAIHGADTDAPCVTYAVHGEERRIDCDFVARCCLCLTSAPMGQFRLISERRVSGSS